MAGVNWHGLARRDIWVWCFSMMIFLDLLQILAKSSKNILPKWWDLMLMNPMVQSVTKITPTITNPSLLWREKFLHLRFKSRFRNRKNLSWEHGKPRISFAALPLEMAKAPNFWNYEPNPTQHSLDFCWYEVHLSYSYSQGFFSNTFQLL